MRKTQLSIALFLCIAGIGFSHDTSKKSPITRVALTDTIYLGGNINVSINTIIPYDRSFSHISEVASNKTIYIEAINNENIPHYHTSSRYSSGYMRATQPEPDKTPNSYGSKFITVYRYKPQSTGVYYFYFWTGEDYMRRKVVVLRVGQRG